jgi:hypothetical protein
LNPAKTPYEFGYLDGGADVSVAMNSCLTTHGACYLDEGKTYNLQYSVTVPGKIDCIGGVATINLTSPTANTRFGSLNSAFYFVGGIGAPTEGVNVQNIVLQCNKLIGVTGSVGVKGFMFQRLKNFYQRGCSVINCASYAYWDYDVATSGTTFCSGTRDDCWAVDCQVSFEQVNVRNVTLNNCRGYISNASLGYVPECIFHSYGGADMQVVYNNCIGIADGVCPSVFLGLLEAKNITFNDCQLINNYNNGASIQAAVIFDASGTSNFDGIVFSNCILKSLFSPAVTLSIGSGGTLDNSFHFDNCKIDGYQIGVQLNVSAGKFYFSNTETRARASGAVTPYGIYNNGTPTVFLYTGGMVKASTSGSGTPTISNLPTSYFVNTFFDPAGTQPPRVRQRVVGSAVIGGDGSTYSLLNVVFPAAALNWTSESSASTPKVTASIHVDYGISVAGTYPGAVAMAYPFVISMPANNTVRFVGNTAMNGKTARYEVTEWE